MDFTYELPEDRIALYPLPERDTSRLLVYKERQISHESFRALPDQLPDNAFLFFNNTRVIPARLRFQKESGAHIEIFLLTPVAPSPVVAEAMVARRSCTWHCTIGNLRRWNTGVTLKQNASGIEVTATLTDRTKGIVRLDWDTDDSFATIVDLLGETPLPPYLRRPAEASDRERYQTVYSRHDGAVAAPTAGLHFTPAVFEKLAEKGIGHDFLTLHVSAGTFQPIKTHDPAKHVMHEEQVIVSRGNIDNLLLPNRLITAVGTTAMRTLESLYWYGVRLIADPNAPFHIEQTEPYTTDPTPPAPEAFRAVLTRMDRDQTDSIVGETSIYIRPGYKFRVCDALITNFHQPGSTLILLVAAFVGDDWREIYAQALGHNYRFLSYGDSSLLFHSGN